VKILNKLSYKILKKKIDIVRSTAIFFFIFSLIPWINFGLNDFDIQPWSFVFAIIFLACLKKVIVPVYSIKILILVLIGLSFALLATNSINIFFLFRSIVNYLSLPILYVAFYNYFIRYNFPLKLFVIFNFLWIGVGLIQLRFPEIAFSFVNQRNIDAIRGSSSLAPEPTFFAIFLFFSSWVLIETKNFAMSKNIKILLFINFLAVLFIAKSSMVFLFYIITITSVLVSKFFYTCVDLKFLKKSVSSFTIYFIIIFLALIIFKNFFYNTRLFFFIERFFNSQSILEIIKTDASINSRVESVYLSVIGSLKNYLLPGGLDTFVEMRKEILNSMENEIFYNRVESNKIMSWIGSIIYELGIFGIMIITLFFKAIYRNFRGSLFYLATLIIILFSAIPVAFSLIPMLFSLMVYNKKFKTFNK
jgi:hypothetical protein